MTTTEATDDDTMTPEERLLWLRERGVLVETPEERKAKAIRDIMNEADDDPDKSASTTTSSATTASAATTPSETISYVMVPADTSKPLKEMTFKCPIQPNDTPSSVNDYLSQHLKPMIKLLSSGKDVDLELFRSQQQKSGPSLLSSGGAGGGAGDDALSSVTDETLRAVAAQQTSVEIFPLVRPTASNHYTGVNIYLDEIGMLKRLPLNTRATQFAKVAGFNNPPPTFYGDVFLGRVKSIPALMTSNGIPTTRHLNLTVGQDTSDDAGWLQRAAMDNLEFQTSIHGINSQQQQQQPTNDGEDGIAKDEGRYSWTQTEDELEVVVTTSAANISTKDISVQFKPQTLVARIKKEQEPLVSLNLFERVDPDGCTWTLERGGDSVKIVITMEKAEEASWPRIED